jgi:G5 domain
MAAGTGVLVVLVGGGAVSVVALTRQDPPARTAPTGQAAPAVSHALIAPPPPADRGFGNANPIKKNPIKTNPTDTNPTDTNPTDTNTGEADIGEAKTGPDVNTAGGTRDRTATRAPSRPDAGKAKPAASATTTPTPSTPIVTPVVATPAVVTPPAAGTAPGYTTQTVIEMRPIPYQTLLVRDPSLRRGDKQLLAEGIPGLETLRYLVTYAGGAETGRWLIDSTVSREPQHQLIASGSRSPPQHDDPRDCDPDPRFCLRGRSDCPDDDPDSDEAQGSDGAPPDVDQAEPDLDDPSDLDGLTPNPAC